MTERVTLITGASAGIGTELARVFASHGHRLALVARRADRLATLAGEITAAGGAAPIVIPCDLTQPDACDKIAKALSAAGADVEYVVNNAGFGVFGLGQLDLFGILELRGRKPPPDSLPTDRSDAWKSLDVSLLHTLLVDPLIAESGHPREQVLRYTRSPHEAVAEVLAGKADVAFFLNPTPVSSVLAVADAGDLMPEKSTYFFPKPPAGLVMRDLDSPT